MPTITFTPQEAEQHFYDALCNAIGSGYMNSYGLELQCEEKDYALACTQLSSTTGNPPCIEDVWMQVLRNGQYLKLADLEGAGEHDATITMKDVYERLPLVPTHHMADLLNDDGDAVTADAIVQTIFYKDIIFG